MTAISVAVPRGMLQPRGFLLELPQLDSNYDIDPDALLSAKASQLRTATRFESGVFYNRDDKIDAFSQEALSMIGEDVMSFRVFLTLLRSTEPFE
ncbi:hypothetical protein DICVIV_11425 [Dictyocaulus viviparus]|uniref:Uncharacterized protein n=1 Tax=Dictyocaulus viviparus TaxID=29172 RepID=A0A0D8XFT8_DICVI|nr:hypothetical protein DICVIV_11425 [Dictyocaulus viviparus]